MEDTFKPMTEVNYFLCVKIIVFSNVKEFSEKIDIGLHFYESLISCLIENN